jgi:hypothetical protein
MELEIPESLELEHEELHRQLVDAVKEGGKADEAAKAVAEILHPHFEKEEVLTSWPNSSKVLLSVKSGVIVWTYPKEKNSKTSNCTND